MSKKLKHFCKWIFTLLRIFVNISELMEVTPTSTVALSSNIFYIIQLVSQFRALHYFECHHIAGDLKVHGGNIKIAVFWITIQCALLCACRRFGGTSFIHFNPEDGGSRYFKTFVITFLTTFCDKPEDCYKESHHIAVHLH